MSISPVKTVPSRDTLDLNQEYVTPASACTTDIPCFATVKEGFEPSRPLSTWLNAH